MVEIQWLKVEIKWLKANKLSLNAKKTELMVFHPNTKKLMKALNSNLMEKDYFTLTRLSIYASC